MVNLKESPIPMLAHPDRYRGNAHIGPVQLAGQHTDKRYYQYGRAYVEFKGKPLSVPNLTYRVPRTVYF